MTLLYMFEEILVRGSEPLLKLIQHEVEYRGSSKPR